eukprot:1161187-Amphidinium_carterae.1
MDAGSFSSRPNMIDHHQAPSAAIHARADSTAFLLVAVLNLAKVQDATLAIKNLMTMVTRCCKSHTQLVRRMQSLRLIRSSFTPSCLTT